MKKEDSYQEKSKVLVPGYINIYSELSAAEMRQHRYKTLYKDKNPDWDESMVYLSQKFGEIAKKKGKISVLDAGCGNGNYVIDENRNLIDYAVGVDLVPEFTSKNICLDKIDYANLTALPYSDESFDVVISLWVLEHLENPAKVFDEVSRVLKKGGRFLFVTPNIAFFPLYIVHFFKSMKLNHFVNKVFFGRESKDVFKSYYRANTVRDLRRLVEGRFKVDVLRLNYDPGYTSFSYVTFALSNLLHYICVTLGCALTFPHIVGVLTKLSIDSNELGC